MSSPELVEQAADIVAHVNEHIELPDRVQTMQRYRADITGDHHFELRAQSCTSGDMFMGGNSRYLYLSGPHDKGACRPLVSVNINSLVRDGEIQGLLDRTDDIADILPLVDDEHSREAKLLAHALKLYRHDTLGAPLDTDIVQELDGLFVDLISDGATVSDADTGRVSEDDTRVWVREHRIEGSLQHTWPLEVMAPKVRILVHEPDQERETVLDQYGPSQFECYEQIANSMLRAAAYSKEEDILRDDEGKIIGVTSHGYPEAAIRDAEKALGLRDLQPARLAYIEKYVQAVFV